MTKQATMRTTRNAKTPVKTPPPAKKGLKTPVKADPQAPADDNPVVVDLTAAIAVETGTKSESVKVGGSDKVEKEEITANGKSSVEGSDGMKEQDAKLTNPSSAKKQQKGAGAKPLESKETVIEIVSTIIEVGLEQSKGTEVEDAAEEENDEEMEENDEDDAGEEEDEAVGEDEEGEEEAEDEEVEDAENEGDGEEEVEEEVEEEDGEGDEAEEEAVGDAQPELQAPKLVTERQKSKRLEVFIGGLDKEATEDDVKKAFESIGEVVEVRLRKNLQTGKNKGYAFVRFASAEQATRAYTELERTQIREKSCHVVPSEDNNVLFVGNLNKSWKKEQVEEKLKEYGIEGIEELTLMEDARNEGMNRGFAFIELATHNDALKTLKRLAKPDALFGSERSAKVAWAQQNEPDEVVMSQVKSVFVDGIPATWGEDKVKEHFGKYGEIERVVLARNMPRSKRHDFAFVNFAQRDAAVACIDALKDLEEVVDGEDKIMVKAKLAQPRPKGKASKGGVRGGYPIGGAARPGRGRGISRGGLNSRRPGRGRRGFIRGGGRGLGRTYDDPGVHKLLRVLKEQSVGDERSLPIGRSKERRFSGGLARPPRISQRGGGYSRRENLRSARINRPPPSHDYRMPLRYDAIQDDYLPRRGEFSQRLPSRRSSQSGHVPLPPRDDGYLRRAGRSYGYERDMGAGFSRVRERGPGMKRSYSALDDEPSYYDGPRGYPRARIDYGDVAPSQYDPLRAPVGSSTIGATGRALLPPSAGGPVTQPSLGLYDQSGGLSGASLGTAGASSLYGSGNLGYGSSLSGAGDYISSGAEVRAASLYGAHSGSSGYSYPGATGSASYY